MIFVKVDQIFLEGQYGGQPVLSLIQVFQKMPEKEIKHELLMEIYKEYLRGQCGLDCIYLLKIHEHFLKGQYGSNHIVFFCFLCRIPVLENRANSKI